VTLDFTPAATRQFGELTARISGHKLAVLVDGTVTSAPIIRGAIRGGHASITLGNGASPLDAQRLAMHLAVLHRHCGISLADQDVFANVVGGVRIGETGSDLALILAVLSSYRNRVLPRDLIVFGEIGLTGEVRGVPNGQERLREAIKHGFRRAIIPRGNRPKPALADMDVRAIATLNEALDVLNEGA